MTAFEKMEAIVIKFIAEHTASMTEQEKNKLIRESFFKMRDILPELRAEQEKFVTIGGK